MTNPITKQEIQANAMLGEYQQILMIIAQRSASHASTLAGLQVEKMQTEESLKKALAEVETFKNLAAGRAAPGAAPPPNKDGA